MKSLIPKVLKGILEKDIYPLDINSVSDIIEREERFSEVRTNPFKYEDGPEKILRHLHDLNANVLIAVGSIDTLMVAEKLYERGVRLSAFLKPLIMIYR